jgi:short-subunit dehydrogenase
MKDAGVHVTHVAPGAVDTGLYGLKDSARKKLLRWHIMTTPEQVAKRGVSGLLKGRRCVIPGAINLVFIGLVKIVPLGFVNLLKKIFLINNNNNS